jgi:hypothetical protein
MLGCDCNCGGGACGDCSCCGCGDGCGGSLESICFRFLKKKEKKKVSLSFRGVGKCEEKIGKREKERCGVVREWNPTLRSHLGEVRSVQMETKNLSEAEK